MNAHPPSDEVTLTDLLVVIVKRKALLLSCFLAVFLLAIAYAFLAADKYEYVSIYQLAELRPGSPIESEASAEEKVRSIYLPGQVNESPEFNGEAASLTVSVSSPKDTTLLTLATTAKASLQPSVENFHTRLLEKLNESQERLYKKYFENYSNNLNVAKENYNSLVNSSGSNAAELATRYIEQIQNYQTQLDDMTKGEIVEVAVKNPLSAGAGTALILAGGAFLGGVLGLLLVLVAEVCVNVNRRLESDRDHV